MTISLIPELDALVADWLAEDPDVEAIVGDRISGQTPSIVTEPWIRVTLIDNVDDATSRREHFIQTYLQLDCYAGATGGQGESSTLVGTVRAVLKSLEGTVRDSIVITEVIFTSHGLVADTDLGEPARERYILGTAIRHHPAS